MPNENRPWLFDDLDALTSTTQIYTAKKSDTDAPKEYKYPLSLLLSWLALNMDQIVPDTENLLGAGAGVNTQLITLLDEMAARIKSLEIKGEYADHAAAAAGGVALGELFEASVGNGMGATPGAIIRRKF